MHHSCDVVLGSPDWVAPILAQAPQIQWVQSTWAGVDRLMAPELRRDYRLTGVKDVFGPPMAEFVLCYMLMQERKVIQRLAAQRQHRWDSSSPGTLAGKTLGIIGLGDIGAAVARQCAMLGMRVVGVNGRGRPVPGVDIVGQPDDLAQLLPECDYVVAILPDTPATRRLINKSQFARMKTGAYFINVGRGSSVDHDALAQAVERGKLSGAALDVFEIEPLPVKSPLWDIPNVIITSHTAAPSFAEPIAAIFLANLHRYIAGEPLQFLVNFELGY